MDHDYSSSFAESEDYESEDYDADYVELLCSLDVLCYVVYSLVLVLGVLGNGVVIWVTGFQMKKTINTVWFLNLAVSDFLYVAFLPLTVTFQAMDFHWPFGKFMCKVHFTVDCLTMFASAYVLVVISVDRCVSVAWPEWVQNHRSATKASYVSLGVWALALVLSTPEFILLDTRPNPYYENYTECLTDLHSNFTAFSDDDEPPAMDQPNSPLYRAMEIIIFYLGYVGPFVIIVSCYAVIIHHQLRKNGSLASHLGGRPFKITAAVIASFFLCFAPLHTLNMLYAVPPKRSERIRTVVIYVADCLEALYHCLNPLFYMLMGQEFKDKACKPVLQALESAFTEEECPSKPSTNLSLSDAE